MAKSAKKPRFLQTISNVTSVVGGEAFFEARVSGGDVKVKWFRGLIDVTDAPNYHAQCTKEGYISLRIPEVMEEDGGDFICQVTNSAGKSSCVAELIVQSEASAPSFTEQLEAVEIAQGEIARFQAGVAGVPTPRVNWTREGEAISNSNDFQIRCEGDLHCLTITNAQQADSGSFTATAVNQAGEAKTTAALTVSGDGKTKDEDVQKRKALMSQGESAPEQKEEN